MNLSKLFEMQKALDARIIKEKGLEGQNLLPNTVLALKVELGELANEWRGFKHWSNDREPRTKVGYGLSRPGEWRNPLLEEYVDSLHFILSIGRQLDIDISNYEHEDLSQEFVSITEAFNHCFDWVVNVSFFKENGRRYEVERCYFRLVDAFLSIGKMLGFTPEQIEQGYLDKNAVNHERQSNGY